MPFSKMFQLGNTSAIEKIINVQHILLFHEYLSQLLNNYKLKLTVLGLQVPHLEKD